ncbi:unnamed protein product [Phytophthora lilii]|uniref:Unnamed protein product n=1 Tax=Phytophthora lilii TaxID=2077276 RepID=A0A9W6TQU9_9STRA|nr:unnamed protein product [Phytophthora lilii]
MLFAAATLLESANAATELTVTKGGEQHASTLIIEIKQEREVTSTEERVLPNIDLVVSDAAKKLNKEVVWKIKFAIWKYLLRRTPLQARKKMGMSGMGRSVFA